MVRLRINDEPMTPAERRRRSDAERAARGEQRVTAWLTAEASAALDAMVGPKKARAELAKVLSEAVIYYQRKKR